MSKKLEALVVSGPTTDGNPHLKPFNFPKNTIRNGVPDHFDFAWIVTSPKTLLSKEPFFYTWKDQK